MTQDELNYVLVLFAKLDKLARRRLIEALKKAKVKLDFNYPNGVPDEKPQPAPVEVASEPPAHSQTTQTI